MPHLMQQQEFDTIRKPQNHETKICKESHKFFVDVTNWLHSRPLTDYIGKACICHTERGKTTREERELARIYT
jgi:hypothetical protein